MNSPIPYAIKLKTALKMCIQRLRYAQEKQQSLAKKSRRDVAQLLAEGKEQKAHYRIESLINDDVHEELLEILELYCELLHARIALLNNVADEADLIENHVDDGINEAVRAVIYAVLHASEIKELQQVKELLAFKFGLDFLRAILDDRIGVPDKVLKKCSPNLPTEDLVTLYLREIALAYEVPYSKALDTLEDDNSEDEKVSSPIESGSDDGKPIVAVESGFLDDSKHPITVKKPRKNSDNMGVGLKVPQDIKKDIRVKPAKENGNDTDLDELKKRFAALRR
ncbi:LANO_0G02322g1_1 [Lachancea nothofagi CBS 11611]|uniref:LANO_0G02322g1_1 n=1 Tax=Lachancea nothofagi CBS 11611 TaxID=1266666 RepID=A0A1G4KF00_9SACH|nr:LANO_0G02322g1_1 [Lachancea nothofagi CBS 11611]